MKKGLTTAIIAILAVIALVFGILFGTNNADKTRQINVLTETTEAQELKIEGLAADTAEKAAQIESLIADAADKAAQIEALTADAADKAAQIEVLTADAADKAAQIETLTADAADKVAQIETLTTDTADKAAQIEALTADAADKAAQIEALTAEKEELSAQYAAAQAEIQSLTASDAEKQAAIDTQNAQIAELTAQASVLEAQITDLTAQIEELKSAPEAFELTETPVETAEPAETVENDTLIGGADAATEIVVTAENGTTEEAAAETVLADDALLCTVNGKEITYKDVSPYVQSIISEYVSEGYDSADPDLVAYAEHVGMYYAHQYMMLDELGEELNVTFTAEDEEAARTEALEYWDEIIAYYCEAYYGITDASAEEEKTEATTGTLALLESMGYTRESFVADEVNSVRYSKIMDVLCKDITVSDSDLDEYINSLVESDKELYAGDDVSYYEMMTYYGYTTYYKPEGYRAVTHILLQVDEELLSTYNDLAAAYEDQQGTEAAEDAVTAEQVEAARQAILDSVRPTVDEIMEKFNAGTPFADLIAEYGTDPGMQAEGVLETGYEVAATSLMWDIPFRDAAMSIENIGEVSEPVVGAYGVHIVYYLKDIPGGAVEFTEEEREGFRAELLDEKQSETLSEALSARLDAAVITYTDEGAPFVYDLGE